MLHSLQVGVGVGLGENCNLPTTPVASAADQRAGLCSAGLFSALNFIDALCSVRQWIASGRSLSAMTRFRSDTKAIPLFSRSCSLLLPPRHPFWASHCSSACLSSAPSGPLGFVHVLIRAGDICFPKAQPEPSASPSLPPPHSLNPSPALALA